MKEICMETFDIRECIIILTESESLEVFPQTDKITSDEARELLEISGDGVREVIPQSRTLTNGRNFLKCLDKSPRSVLI